MRLILLGVPGSGKSTQGAILSSQWQIPHISTGEILRQAIANQTALGLKAKAYVENSEFVPDYLMFDLIRQRLTDSSTQRGWILDRFPVNLSQAQFLDQLLATLGQSYNQVFSLYVPTDVLVQRLQQKRRLHDHTELIYKQIEVYQEQTAPVIQHYRQKGCLTVINGDRPVEIVTHFLETSFSNLSLTIHEKTLNTNKRLMNQEPKTLSI